MKAAIFSLFYSLMINAFAADQKDCMFSKQFDASSDIQSYLRGRGHNVTIEEAMHAVESVNPDVRRSRLTTASVAANLREVIGASRPSFSLLLSGGNALIGGPYIDRNYSSRQLNNSLRYDARVYSFNADSLQIKSAKISQDSAKNNEAAILYSSKIAAAEAYYEIAANREILLALSSLLESAELKQRTAHVLSQSGIQPRLDSYFIDNHVAQNGARLLAIKRQLEVASGRLAILLGTYVDGIYVAFFDSHCVIKDMHTTPNFDPRNHPAYLTVESRAASSRTLSKAVMRSSLGLITLGVGLSSNQQRLSARSESKEYVASINVQYSLPIFDNGVVKSRAESLLAQANEIEIQKEYVESMLRHDYTEAISIISETSGQLKVYRESIEIAEKARTISAGRYDNGLGTVLELLRAESDYIELVINYYLTLSIYKAKLFEIRVLRGENGL